MVLLIYLYQLLSIHIPAVNFSFTELEFTLSHRVLFIKTSYLIKVVYLLSS